MATNLVLSHDKDMGISIGSVETENRCCPLVNQLLYASEVRGTHFNLTS